MKGIINKGIQELVEDRYGAAAWDQVKETAKCDESFFSASDDYPDQMTIDLAIAASKVSKQPLETILIEFGKFWVPNTGANAYPTFFKLSGGSARNFLLNMDRVHKHVTKSISSAQPPGFEFEELPDGRLLMHYKSDRRLCPVLHGLILGVGIQFNEELEVEEISCTKNGDPRCTFEVKFHGA